MKQRRLDQILSSLGYCSRKEAQQWCNQGKVHLASGDLLDDAAARVDPHQVRVLGSPLEFPGGLLVMFHKPVGLVCSHDSAKGPRVYDALPPQWLQRSPKITTVGRLDKETSGLLLLTDQGQLVQQLTSPKHHVDKVYLALLDREPSPETELRFAQGIELKEQGEQFKTLPARFRALGARRVEVTVQEGKYHQVRRMFAAVGIQVLALERTRFGQWSLGNLASGEWRSLAFP